MSATMNAAMRLVLQHMNDTGETPEKVMDTDQLDRAGLVLSGYKEIMAGRRLRLAPDAADYELQFTDVILIAIVSRDYPFSWRIADGETLHANVRVFVLAGADENTGVAQGHVLLTGNGTNEADLEIWLIEKP